MNLYILKYNNYYNRTIKKEDSLTDYLEYQLGNVIQGVSFNPGDGIATQQVVNLSEDQIGDYLLAVNEYNEIDSRWFILDCRRERTGQYTLTLRRDLVADNYSNIISAPCFIEKATLDDSDPMIYNSEDMTFNQIKTSETQLKDETGCPWIVGYIASGQELEVDVPYSVPISSVVQNISEYKYYEYRHDAGGEGNFEITYFVGTPNNIIYGFGANRSGYSEGIIFAVNENGAQPTGANIQEASGYKEAIGYFSTNSPQYYISDPILKYGGNFPDYPTNQLKVASDQDGVDYNGIINSLKNNISSRLSTLQSYIGAYIDIDFHTEQEVNDFLNQNGAIIYEQSTGKYYRVSINSVKEVQSTANVTSGNLFNVMKSITDNTLDFSGTPGTASYALRVTAPRYMLFIDEDASLGCKLTMTTNRYSLNDSPYDMFCIPYSDDLKIYKNGVLQFTANKELAFNIATYVSRKYGGSSAQYLYDLQLLPYCPVRYCIKSDGTFDIGNNYVDYVIATSESGEENIAAVYYANSSSFTLNISNSIQITNKKQQSQTDKWRLVSPNYSGQFEFNATLNNGVDFFNVDCTYKPYNPYIHINPNFKNLYGQDFNDARGLIVGGDFSLPQTTDAWAQYEFSNKNYQQMFDRQIQNMEVNNAVQREQQKWQIASGAIGAGMSGAFTGALVGGPVGALVGGLVGAGTSTAAGIRDYQLSEQLRQEAIDYREDQFGYQLGNIQALPYSLAKTSAFTYNNKIFPILEYYTCTPQEKAALQNKLYYNGMTVMRIGTIQEFLRSEPSYIKGKLIRLEGTDNNFHVVNEIANEINKGVFI